MDINQVQEELIVKIRWGYWKGKLIEIIQMINKVS
jgi:hypothetical protein